MTPKTIAAVLMCSAALVLAACGQTGGAPSSGAAPGKPTAAGSASSQPAQASASAATSSKPAAAGEASASAKGTTAGSGLTTVRLAVSSSSTSNAGHYLADGLGFFEKQGLRVEEVTFNSDSAIAPALATNRVDVADVGVNPAMFNMMSGGTGAKLVADRGSTPEGFGFLSIVVRKDLADKIKGPADLKGKNLALTPPGLGTTTGFALAAYLAKANLTPNDLHIQPLAFPEQAAALSNKAVDGAIMPEPYATQTVVNGIAVRLITFDKVVPGQQIAGIAFASKFMSDKRDVAQRWMVAYLQGVRAYNDAFRKGTNKDQVVQILATKTTIKDMNLWAQMIPAGLDPDGKLNVQNIQDQGEFFKKVGLIQDVPAPTTYIDESFAKKAVETLGPYK